MTHTFYQVAEWFSVKPGFYPSIDLTILDSKLENGYILEYTFIPNHTTVPVRKRSYDVSTIEYYELQEYLKDNPEMNEKNYLVYTIESDDGEPDMLTIVKLIGGTYDDQD